MASTKSTAPEFQIVNETTVGGYLNYMKDVIRYGIFTGDPLVPHLTNGEKYTSTINATYLKELALVADPAALVRRLNLLLCAGQMSAATQNIITTALAGTALRPATDKPEDIANSRLDRVCAGVLLTMASADYLVQK